LLRSGAGALGSIPGSLAAGGVFAVIFSIRFANQTIQLKVSSKDKIKKTAKEIPMIIQALICFLDTVVDFGGNLASGLLLS
jgi:hypothetical protein